MYLGRINKIGNSSTKEKMIHNKVNLYNASLKYSPQTKKKKKILFGNPVITSLEIKYKINMLFWESKFWLYYY